MCATWDGCFPHWIWSGLSSFNVLGPRSASRDGLWSFPRAPGTWAGPLLTYGSFVPRCQSCGPLQLHPRLERGFCLANCVKPDFKKDRGLRFLCARFVPGSFLILRSQLRKNQRADGNWEGLTSLSRLCFLLPWFPFLSDLRVFILFTLLNEWYFSAVPWPLKSCLLLNENV